MGCASSNPLVQGSKQFAETAKDSVAEVVSKGENVLHGKLAKAFCTFKIEVRSNKLKF